MILLAIDTATEGCSAALWVNGKLFHRFTVQARMHAELILPFIEDLLQEAGIEKKEIQGLVVARGPGAFTGVRIGIAVAQGLALALDVPVVSVSNLKTLAFVAYQQLKTKEKKTIVVATDARMKEVYWSQYSLQDGLFLTMDEEKVGHAKRVNLENIDAYIGSGFHVYPELITFSQKNPMNYETQVYSHAKDMLLMVKDSFVEQAKTIECLTAVYLREP